MGKFFLNKKNKMSEKKQEESEKVYKTFDEFWPFYLSQHSNRTCRRLHVIGTFLGLCWLFYTLFVFGFSKPLRILFTFVIGYFFAWVGHFFFEKNKPATFKYPLWSFLGDFKMFYLIMSGKMAF